MNPREIMLQTATVGDASSAYALHSTEHWTYAGPGQTWDRRHWEPMVDAMMAALADQGVHLIKLDPAKDKPYRDDTFPARHCDTCGRPYRGPAVYCSFICAVADA